MFALLNVFTLIPAQHLNSYVMAFMRYLAGTLLLLPLIVRLGTHRTFHSYRKSLHVARGVIHACGMFLWFAALPLISLAELTALGFTGPIFVTIGAALFLGEDVRLRRWAAVLVGFLALAAGGWLLTHPGVIRRLEQSLERLPLHPRWHGLLRLLREALLAITKVRQLMRPRPLLLGTLLASLCWLLEAAVLQGIYGGLGLSLGLHQTSVIRTAMALGGVISLLPAGLGTSEATAIGLAMAYGAGRSEALAATLVLRFATLAVPCGLGVLSLLRQRDLGKPS